MTHDKNIERKLVAIMLFFEGKLKECGKRPDDWPDYYWDGLRTKFQKTASLTDKELEIVDSTLFNFNISLYDPLIEPYL